MKTKACGWFWLVGVLAISLVSARAGQVLAEWSGEKTPSIPPFIGFYVKEGVGVSAQMIFDDRARTATGQGAIRIEMKEPSENPKDGNVLLMFTYPKGVEAGKGYRITVTARASQPVDIKMRPIQDGEGFSTIGVPEMERFTVGTEWKELTFDFVANEGFSGSKVRIPNISGMGRFERGTSLYIGSWKLEQK